MYALGAKSFDGSSNIDEIVFIYVLRYDCTTLDYLFFHFLFFSVAFYSDTSSRQMRSSPSGTCDVQKFYLFLFNITDVRSRSPYVVMLNIVLISCHDVGAGLALPTP